uniref:Armadillo repeat-containing protein 1 n=1 Tax=Panagrellus redivivus TaxID=6233 RepID=A0A7E4VGX4_PANRE
MVDSTISNEEEKAVLRVLKSFYRLCIARPDKSIFITDPSFSVTLTTYVKDDRPRVMEIMTKILQSLTDSTNNAKLISGLPDFETHIARAIEKPFPPKTIHTLLVVQSRLTALKKPKPVAKLPGLGPERSNNHSSFFKAAGTTKQLVYQLLDNNEEKQSTLQERSIPIKGVVSLCFAGISGVKDGMKCIYRVQDTLAPKILERCIFNCGYTKVHRVVRLDDGSMQTYEVFRDEVFTQSAEEVAAAAANQGPQYLDDSVALFDPAQTLVPTGQTAEQSSWFTGVKQYLSFW